MIRALFTPPVRWWSQGQIFQNAQRRYMAKKTTTTTKTKAATGNTARPETKQNKAPAAPKAPPTAAEKPKAAPAKRLTARKLTTNPTSKPIVKAGFTQDDVALRAYFIAEKRQAKGHAGDEHGDWIEAERQLRTERGIEA